MKRIVSVLAMAALVGSFAGCKSSPKTVTSEKTPFDVMQEKANQITAAGGLAAVGMGESRTVSLALDKAKTRGRAELARVMEAKVESLQKNFLEEIGEGKDSEVNALFSEATKVIAAQVLRGSVPKDLKYETKDGLTTAWALMVQDPKVIQGAFEQQANSQRNQYTRFRASQAFAEMEKDVQRFEEFKKNDGLVVGP